MKCLNICSGRVGMLNVNFSLEGLGPAGQRWISDVSNVSLPCPFPLGQT